MPLGTSKVCRRWVKASKDGCCLSRFKQYLVYKDIGLPKKRVHTDPCAASKFISHSVSIEEDTEPGEHSDLRPRTCGLCGIFWTVNFVLSSA
jgi:hypothetical protein